MCALYCRHRRLDSVISCVLFFCFFSPSRICLCKTVWVPSEVYIFQCTVQYLKITLDISLEFSKRAFRKLVMALSLLIQAKDGKLGHPRDSALCRTTGQQFYLKGNISLFLLKILFIYFQREGQGGRKRGRETSMCSCLSHTPNRGPGPQLRHVP